MPSTADRCKETTTTTGTGSITLAGAVSAFQSFNTAFGSAPTLVMYAIVGSGTTEWEVGLGTYDGSTTLTRDLVRSSSNANALVNFSAGTKEVFCTITAAQAEGANAGQNLCLAKGQALP